MIKIAFEDKLQKEIARQDCHRVQFLAVKSPTPRAKASCLELRTQQCLLFIPLHFPGGHTTGLQQLTSICLCNVTDEPQLCIGRKPNTPGCLLKCGESTRRHTVNACEEKKETVAQLIDNPK